MMDLMGLTQKYLYSLMLVENVCLSHVAVKLSSCQDGLPGEVCLSRGAGLGMHLESNCNCWLDQDIPKWRNISAYDRSRPK
ncbi:hypothetical protein Nepgr_015198 [Nepenthes gracilis]|uniref:Uncharacterized protein n=1 Tax=Nepenthes gracilis TaxID=150966 RepID=A0AAD3SLP1_NEPGR|nr:hypothetical protein Nepgr_015198 [Nepenthes gracilis]